jgi:hypothetical protein
MHRNAEIWETRHARLEAVFQAKCQQFAQGRKSPSWNFLCEERRNAWRARYDELERRVWHALCVAKGWRKG